MGQKINLYRIETMLMKKKLQSLALPFGQMALQEQVTVTSATRKYS